MKQYIGLLLKSTVTLIFALLSTTCGLPSVDIVAKPLSPIFESTLSRMKFTTPSDDNISGYVVYYKIYSVSDSNAISSDQDSFNQADWNEDYIGNLGNGLPKKRNFINANKLGDPKSSYVSHVIEHRGGGETIVIHFVPAPGVRSPDEVSIYYENDENSKIALARNEVYTDPDYGTVNNYKSFYYRYNSSDSDLNSVPNLGGTFLFSVSVVVYSLAKFIPGREYYDSEPIFLGTISNVEYENYSIAEDTERHDPF